MQFIEELLEKMFIKLGMRFYRFIHIHSDGDIVESMTFSRDNKFFKKVQKLEKKH